MFCYVRHVLLCPACFAVRHVSLCPACSGMFRYVHVSLSPACFAMSGIFRSPACFAVRYGSPVQYVSLCPAKATVNENYWTGPCVKDYLSMRRLTFLRHDLLCPFKISILFHFLRVWVVSENASSRLCFRLTLSLS